MTYRILLLLCLPALASAQTFQLAKPRLSVDSIFFRKSARVALEFDLDGAVIRYSVEGGYPADTAPVYKTPLTITQPCVLRAKAAHPDFMPGPMAEQELVKVAFVPDSVSLHTAPDSQYTGRGAAALTDFQKGSRDLRDGRWLGFRGDTVVVEFFFTKGASCKRLVVSTLSDPGAWVFPPARIEVLGASAGKNWSPMGVWSMRAGMPWRDIPVKYDLFQKVMLRVSDAQRMQIRIVPYGPLPEGHPGAGQQAWLFLDEISVN